MRRPLQEGGLLLCQRRRYGGAEWHAHAMIAVSPILTRLRAEPSRSAGSYGLAGELMSVDGRFCCAICFERAARSARLLRAARKSAAESGGRVKSGATLSAGSSHALTIAPRRMGAGFLFAILAMSISLPAYPQQRTLRGHLGPSEQCQQPTHALQHESSSA